jgi:hypothetical protein
VTTRVTARGQARTSLEGMSVDVLICGASFAGLAVTRELPGGREAIDLGGVRVRRVEPLG